MYSLHCDLAQIQSLVVDCAQNISELTNPTMMCLVEEEESEPMTQQHTSNSNSEQERERERERRKKVLLLHKD